MEQTNDRSNQGGVLSGVTGAVSKLGEVGMQAVDRGADEETVMAELVDGSEVLFVDPQARRKSLYEYDLVVLDAPQYPEPAILKNDREVEIPDGSILSMVEPIRALVMDEKRLIVRACTLVKPDRVDDVPRDNRVELPETIVDETIPQRSLQAPDFYRAVLKGVRQA